MSLTVRRASGICLGLLLPLAAIALVFLALPATAHASNVVVTVCTAAGLKNKLAVAVDGDVVTFVCPGGSATIVVTQTQVLQHDITINGGNVITLSGGSAVGVLAVPAGHKVTLSFLTLAHGLALQGGALAVSGTVAANNVTFFSNRTTAAFGAAGGAAYVAAGGQLAANNSKFLTNTAQAAGNGGGIASTGVLTTINDVFTGNKANAGGAIMLQGGRAYVAGSLFTNNSAYYGGAITTYGNLVLYADEFDHNHTSGIPSQLDASPDMPQVIFLPLGGGALSVDASANVAIEQTLFFSNTALNGPFGLGGAIVNNGDLALNLSRLNSNTAQNDGGAVYNAGNLAAGHSDFEENFAFGIGGAISNTGSLNVNTSLLAGNVANGSGGAVDNRGHSVLSFDLLAENDAASGGALHNDSGGILFVAASRLVLNVAITSTGGAIRNNGALTVTDSTLDKNYANQNGAALISGNSGATALVLNSTIISNTSVPSAAGLRQTSGAFNLINTIVSGNTPDNCSGTVTDGGHNLQFGDTTCGLGLTANPRLLPEQHNGGPFVGTVYGVIPTFALRANSPAIGAGDDAACPAHDERGFLRNSPCDIGAIENAYLNLLPLITK